MGSFGCSEKVLNVHMVSGFVIAYLTYYLIFDNLIGNSSTLVIFSGNFSILINKVGLLIGLKKK